MRQVETIDTQSQHTVGQHGSDDAHQHRLSEERLADEAPRGTHQLHGMYDEAVGIDAQAHRIANQRERHEGQQQGQHQQDDAHTTDVHIHLIHQVFHIGQVAHALVLLQLLGNPLQRVAAGIVCIQTNLQRGGEWVEAQEFRGVAAQLLHLLTLCLFLADIVDIVGIGTVVQFATEQMGIVHRH